MSFVDEVEIHATAGRGGKGCIAFRREKFAEFGGPSGGDGGEGGSVILVGTNALNTLSPLRNRGLYRAEHGDPGGGKNCHGSSGDDLRILVPEGTLIHDKETGGLLGDLAAGAELIVAKGGRGGRGNTRFKSATQRAPRRADPGEAGEDRWLRLELKLLADVGLVGLPNAGKSTLISVISAARPKIASYPFTTLVPNLGVVDWADYKSFVVADIPGLIAGSHLGEGLGDQFLRHVQRTSVLLHLVDVSPEAPETPAEAVRTIETELRAFDATLLERPRLVVPTKLDVASPQRLASVRKLAEARGLPCMPISAATGEGLRELVTATGHLVEAHRASRKLLA